MPHSNVSSSVSTAGGEVFASEVSLCVLASSSSGNCSVLRWRENGSPRACLIDAGLSPKKTKNWLRGVGTNLAQVDSIILTHLDRDHCHVGWTGGRVPGHITVRMHGRHLSRAEREGMLHQRTEPFNDEFRLSPAVRVRTVMMSHDDLGVASFRFEFSCAPQDGTGCGYGVSLGFATDLGRVTDDLVSCMQGVDVLAVESNYCPQLQNESERPAFLKRRIMGGRGHLSNHECLDAITRIAPREHVVLLHLSRECNHPNLVSDMHEGSDYAVTIARPDKPTRWVVVGEHAAARVGAPPVVVVPSRPAEAASLWESFAAS